jgi:hypothetical protein
LEPATTTKKRKTERELKTEKKEEEGEIVGKTSNKVTPGHRGHWSCFVVGSCAPKCRKRR